jgi:hypothetical protein
MSEITRQQLLITLVHGTWPRGVFPRIVRFKQWVRELTRRQRRGPPPPFWFEEGSPFLARLSTELGDIAHKMKPLLWSGENSIVARDNTARVLAEHLSAEHAEHPQANQLVIAHSHGGNIALRALYLSQRRDSFQLCGRGSATPFVVTLATPFVDVHQANFGDRPTRVRIAISGCIFSLIWLLPFTIFKAELFSSPILIPVTVLLVLEGFASWYWISRRVAARQNRVEALADATRFGPIASAQARRLLVIRAIDDEASLVLALGTIFNYGTTKAIAFSSAILPFLIALLAFGLATWKPSGDWHYNFAQIIGIALIFVLLGVLTASRTVHGTELAMSPMECQINTQSAPDATDVSQVITLISHTYVQSRRHGIYEHENCARAISDWIHSQLCAPPVR